VSEVDEGEAVFTAIIIYIGIGLVVGAIVRFFQQEESSLVGILGTGGVAGVIGGIFANLMFSDDITLDGAGLAGSAILAIVAVLVKRIADRRSAAEAAADSIPPADPGE
jgi:drug/metabolite transporter (DMT)-like permease